MFNYANHIKWIERRVASLGSSLSSQEMQKAEQGIPSIRVRLETAIHMGELVVNNEGKGSLIVAEIESGRYLIDKHDVLLNEDESSCYDEFFRYFSA